MGVDNLESDSDSDDSDIAFAKIDFSGVNFDTDNENTETDKQDHCRPNNWEIAGAFGDFSAAGSLGALMANGNYCQILKNHRVFDVEGIGSAQQRICEKVIEIGSESIEACLELELVGIASLNLFLQSNYTGPTLDSKSLNGVDPHPSFVELLHGNVETFSVNKDALTDSARNTIYQNAVLSELAVDGEWPCQVCNHPYFLLVARSILSTLANSSGINWTNSVQESGTEEVQATHAFLSNTSQLQSVAIWSGRAIVAHGRLMQGSEPSVTLWKEAEMCFEVAQHVFCSSRKGEKKKDAATVMLEWGLAQHYFDRPGKGKDTFRKAQEFSGLQVKVTGAIGKRTKFQQEATAQMLVRAKSTIDGQPSKRTATATAAKESSVENLRSMSNDMMIPHAEEGILLEKVKFDQENENKIEELNILDQSILLALCLDVKNSNPVDGLTGEEMGAFLSRVLDHHDDWMVYSTALLERSWLEFERTHARERAILQMQALSDQHTNRLTITQSTRESVENSAPCQERLRNLHSIVYPPRWVMIQDLADRYAALGVVTSAAELYAEIELWDSVVECYQRAGRTSHAEKIVRERLAVRETPRMWAALGDLTKDPLHYEKAIEVSNGRYSDAYLALGEHYFGQGDLGAAADYFEKSLKVRPLVPVAWFRLGAISMKLERWPVALRAFSEVVMQVPDEADAWANIAAVHMHNKQPSEAYPALNEALKHKRSNWRVWVSKLYTCLDLEKFDEAIQACNTLLDLRAEKQASEGIPPLEEKCIRAISGGALNKFNASKGDKAALDSSRRTVTRVHDLLDRICSSSDGEPWVFDTMNFVLEQTGQNSEVLLETLMKEYRALQRDSAWEKNNENIQQLCRVVIRICDLQKATGEKSNLIKAQFMVRGMIQKIETARPSDQTLLVEVDLLRETLMGIQEIVASM